MKLSITFLLLFISNNYLISSQRKIDYNYFFTLCKAGTVKEIKQFRQHNPTMKINCFNDQRETGLMVSAAFNNYDVAWYLLEHCNTDKMHKDAYGQTFFSLVLYRSTRSAHTKFKKALSFYSCNEINSLCKEIGLNRDPFTHKVVPPLSRNTLKSIADKNVQPGSRNYNAALKQLSANKHIPGMVNLLKRAKSVFDCEPFFGLPLRYRFVVREAFNDGPRIPCALIDTLLQNVDLDCSSYIKQIYVEQVVDKNFLQTPQAFLWKNVCVEACSIAQIKEVNQTRCLTRLLLLPQETLTAINVTLALQNK